MILVHKGRKPPGPLHATTIPWSVQMWLQSQMHVIGDKELDPGELVIKILELVEKRCGRHRSALKVFDEPPKGGSEYINMTFSLDEEEPCHNCGGDGVLVSPSGQASVECPDCEGTGKEKNDGPSG